MTGTPTETPSKMQNKARNLFAKQGGLGRHRGKLRVPDCHGEVLHGHAPDALRLTPCAFRLWSGRALIRPSIGFCFKLSRASAAKAPGGLQRGVDQSALGSFPSEAISLSNSPENRFSVRLFLTAIPSAFFCPIRMTSFLPRVMPV